MVRITMVGDFPRQVEEIGGGVEAVISYLVAELVRESDIELSGVSMDRWGGTSRTETQHGIPVRFVPFSRKRSRLAIRENVRRLRSEIGQTRPDLVHAHIANQYAAASSLAANDRHVPWVLTAHGIRHLEMSLRPGLVNRYREWLTRREEMRLMHQARHLISISPFIDSVFRDVLSTEPLYLDNPVSEKYFEIEPRPESGRVLYVGRLIPRKDVMVLLQAFAKLRKAHPHARLRLAGEGISGFEPRSYRAQLAAYIESANLGESVTFLGQLNEEQLADEYASCQLMVLTSVLETAPMVILQAMAAGVPVVTTDTGGTRYLVEHESSGFVTAIGDTDAIAGAMGRIVADDSLAGSLATRSRQIARDRFSAQRIAAGTAALYRQVLGISAPTRAN